MEKQDVYKLFGRHICGGKTEINQSAFAGLSPADWDSLIELSRRLGITLLIYQEIKKSKYLSGLVPSAAREKFKEIYIDNLARNERLLYEALEAIKLFKDNGITLIALKGLALINDVYDDIALRPMADVDFLIKKEDLNKAECLLLSIGYQRGMPCWERKSHLALFSENKSISIEPHWDIVPPESPLKVDTDGLWQRSRLIRVKDNQMRIFSVEDMLLHLCIHVSLQHKFEAGFIPFCDIARVIHTYRDKIDWLAVIERAYQWHAVKCVYLALLITQEFVGGEIPDKVIKELRPPDLEEIFLEKAKEQIFSSASYNYLDRARLHNLNNILKNKNAEAGFLVLLEAMFPSKEFIARKYQVSLSSPKVYLYYALRLSRLISNYSHLFLKLVCCDKTIANAANMEGKAEALSDWMVS